MTQQHVRQKFETLQQFLDAARKNQSKEIKIGIGQLGKTMEGY